MIVWVLTAHPYHENSVVLGAWDQLKPAVDTFLRAHLDHPSVGVGVGGEQIEAWVLTSFRDGVESSEVNVFYSGLSSVPEELRCVPVVRLLTSQGPRYTRVNPMTHQW